MLGVWYHIVHAQGYIFFGTAYGVPADEGAHPDEHAAAAPAHEGIVFDLTDVSASTPPPAPSSSRAIACQAVRHHHRLGGPHAVRH